MQQIFSKIAYRTSNLAGSARAFIAASTIVILWAITGPIFGFSDTWQLIINTGTTIVTFLMVFLVQHSQNNDTAAIHAKLDNIIKSIDKADDKLIGIEKKTDSCE